MTQFSRTRLLLGPEAMERLYHSHVLLFGLGGVGGHAAEALCRSGVGRLTLVDGDRVVPSNLNRQLFATRETIGLYKTEAAERRLHEIWPECRVETEPLFYLPETADRFDFSAYDYIVDAVDTVAAKLSLAREAHAAGTPLISCMGAGNKLDPTAFRVADISETSVCPLARVMRQELRKQGILHLKVVYSAEKPRPSAMEGGKRVPASCAFVPAAAGLILAGEVVKDLTGVREQF